MESSILGFLADDDVVENKSQSSLKVVPWISWDDWNFVRASLFSSSPNSALQRVSTWRSRGCIPLAIDVTASIVEIQHKDPLFFRDDLDVSASHSEEMLAMLYCMAIMRLVNGVVEKSRKKNEISIGEAADAIGIPRMLIDIRHEGSHRDLPSLQLVRLASKKALDWLISYYWEPQEKEVPVQNSQSTNLKKEIKRRLREVSFCLKAKQLAKSDSSHVKEKRVRQPELLHGRSKFLFLAAGNQSHSNFTGFKKQLAKSLKCTLRLYSASSAQVVYLLLEYLLNALDSSNLVAQSEGSQIIHENNENKQTAFNDWKSVVFKLSRKEPEFLSTLTQAVLEKIETNDGLDDHQSPVNSTRSHRLELLSWLFEWLIGTLKTLHFVSKKESVDDSKMDKHLAKTTMLALLRRCLLLSSPGNKQLMDSALTLAKMTGDTSLLQRLKKLSLLNNHLSSNSEPNPVDSCGETLLAQEENLVHQAEEKLELISRLMQRKKLKRSHSEIGIKSSKWAVAKSWNPCPIGMLPHNTGFSGRLPNLEWPDECGDDEVALSEHCKVTLGRREAENSVQKMDKTCVKRLVSERDCVMQEHNVVAEGGIKGHLMMDGEWKKVGDEELFAIASAVKLLV